MTEEDRAELRIELANLRELIYMRLDGMDRANGLLNENTNRVPTRIDRESARLSELFAERILSVQQRTDATHIAAATAVAAALAAQDKFSQTQNLNNKENIAKSEANTSKQITDLQTLVGSKTQAIDDKLTATNERVTRMESTSAGAQSNRSERRLDVGTVLGFLALGVSCVVLLIGIAQMLTRSETTLPPYAAIAPLPK